MAETASSVAIVTGGAGGIGRAVALRLARDGLHVVVLDRERIEETRSALGRIGAAATVIATDVASMAACEAAVATAAAIGPIGVLCNIAGIRPVGAILETSEAIWDRVFAVNLKSMFMLARAVIPHMQARGGGVILNFGSTSGNGGRGHLAYCAAKGAVIPFTKSLALDHAADRIRVNAIVPGFTESGMTAEFPAPLVEQIARNSVAGRVGLPEDLAAAAAFLVSDAARTISGAVIEVGVLPGGVPAGR